MCILQLKVRITAKILFDLHSWIQYNTIFVYCELTKRSSTGET